jgi:hypothetical protein
MIFKMKYHLICGYKHSGKDTFYKKLVIPNTIKKYKETFDPLNPNHVFAQCGEYGAKTLYFYILAKPGCIDSGFQFYENIPPLRLAMADMVKEEIHEYFKINFTSKECAELAKDNLHFYDEESGSYRSLRSYYIEHAMKMRKSNPDHWCVKAYTHNLLNSDDTVTDIAITDWRFVNERNFFDRVGQTLTYRIFRSEADDENFFDESEHDLDKEITDFLVVGCVEDIAVAKKKFPQYYDYEIEFVV